MPRQKSNYSTGPKSKSKKQPSAPETVDEFLAVGVDFEEAGEKWRAGDAAKSCRFFVRALDAYEAGLQRFPDAFDLAYNRARLQFDLAQQPRLLRFLPQTENDLLQTALDSHMSALALGPEDANILFNTGQILTSLAEKTIEEGSHSADSEGRARKLLQQSVEYFANCLAIQLRQYHVSEEAAATYASMQDNSPGPLEQVPLEHEGVSNDVKIEMESSPESERWASIEEPVTKTTLLETCLAEVRTLTIIIPLLHVDKSALQRVEERCTNLIAQAETYLDTADPELVREFYSAKAKSSVGLLQASFKLGMIGAEDYSRQIDTLYEFPGRDASVEALSDSAEARINFTEACELLMRQSAADSGELAEASGLCWRQLSTALIHLTTAAQLPGLSSPWLIYGRKADVELYRLRLAENNYSSAVSNKETLLKNAEIFYRGAKNLALAAEENDMAEDMGSREGIVMWLRGEGKLEATHQQTLLEMIDERLIGDRDRPM